MSIARCLALALLAVPVLAMAAPEMPGREWSAPETRPAALRVTEAATTFRWGEIDAKSAAGDDGRRMQVGFVRAAPKDFAEVGWQAVAGGYVARFDVASAGAEGLRARLVFSGTGALEIRVRDGGGRVESMSVPAGAGEAWGPWTEGAVQAVEVFSRARLVAGTVRLGAIVHFDRPLDAKAAGSCTIDTPCSTGDPAVDAAIAERKKGVARISFVDGGQAFVCTGTLINTEKFPTPYFLTANHCIGRADVATSITSFWFYEATGCGSGVRNPDYRQVSGGMTIEFSDPNTDHTLLVMNAAPPSGVTFSGWNATKLTPGASVYSISHPAGDVSKWAQATISSAARFPEWEQSAWLTAFSRGIIQGGSSGSGLFTMTNGELQLRGVLSASTTNTSGALSCTNLGLFGVYNRLDVFYPQVARRLMASPPPVADDHGDRPTEASLLKVGASETVAAGRIDYPGDVDVFRIPVTTPGTLIVRSSGGMDTVGVLLDADGERLASNDDAQTNANDFGITYRVQAGTYYLAVSRWESAGTGPYSLAVSLSPVTDNYTDLWWNPDESGWGINFNHQGQVIFATLFTYGADGAPDWFVMSEGALQGDGSFRGDLYRASGPVFNASPWSAISLARVGTMQVSFPAPNTGTLTYTVDGIAVTKQVRRQSFSTSTTCAWSAFDRSYADNFQDLWWNANESGWGINFAHQGDILFATLFTYGADGRSLWFVMSRGDRNPGTRTFEGTLYRMAGAPFNANPWRPATPTSVGSMRVAFSDGDTATLTYSVNGVTVTKSITRQVFGIPATQCESDD
ncbi:MAG: trypsin-like peptidase domain-containing protein [Betaproteobacteria bacterium]|nr:trypsin-like peptidase domain-containing protein [Betaproteobacteria bacterium]